MICANIVVSFLAFIVSVWLGLLIGVSFLATPVKFQAASLALPVALEVGRVTFALFLKVEWGLCGLFAASVISLLRLQGMRASKVWSCGLIALLVLLLLQAFWLLPVLDARITQITAGQEVPASAHHILFVGAEILKTGLLLFLAFNGLRALVFKTFSSCA